MVARTSPEGMSESSTLHSMVGSTDEGTAVGDSSYARVMGVETSVRGTAVTGPGTVPLCRSVCVVTGSGVNSCDVEPEVT